MGVYGGIGISARPPEARPDPPLREAIGQVLRRVRNEQRRTLRDVAEAAGVSMPYLSEVERGRKEASSEVLEAVCGALGLRLADLVAGTYRVLTVDSRPLAAPASRPGGTLLMAA